MKSLLIVSVGWVICGALLFLFATNLWQLWALWLIALGVILGKVLSSEPRIPGTVAAAISLVIAATIMLRAFPFYSLSWEGCSRMDWRGVDDADSSAHLYAPLESH
jgi:uncharacterized membrane protein